MGTHFKNDCPHCLTRGSGFTVVYQWPDRERSDFAFLTAVCGVCNNGILIKSECFGTNQYPNLSQYQLEFPSSSLKIREEWPSRALHIPSDLPANVQSFFVQGLESMKALRWDAAGAMFRKSLDVATKLISPDDKALTLYRRIEKLVADGLLTEAMGLWSHEIRIDGNDAVHDEEPETEEDSVSLQKFTEAFLTYAFSLPSMVARNRAKREDDSTETSVN